jgi:hypothetical protein
VQERLGPKRQQEPLAPNRLKELLDPYRRHEPLAPNRLQEPLAPNRQQELLAPNRQQELLAPNRRQEPLAPNRQQELLAPNRQQEPAQQIDHLKRYPPRRSHATVSPSGGNSVIPSNSAGDVYTNTKASASTEEIDLAGCNGNPTWNDDAIDEARILTNMGAYSSGTSSNKAMAKLVNTGVVAPMSDAQLVAIMFGGAPEDANASSAPDTTSTTTTTSTTGTSSFNQKNYFANIEPQYDTLYTMHNNYDRETLLTPYV